MLTKDYVKVVFYKKGEEEKELKSFFEEDYNRQEISCAITKLQDLNFYESIYTRYVLDLTFYKYDNEQEKYYAVDKKYFSCYGDIDCLRLSLDKPLQEEIDNYFLKYNKFSYKEELKKGLPKERIEEIEELISSAVEDVYYLENYAVYEEFDKITETERLENFIGVSIYKEDRQNNRKEHIFSRQYEEGEERQIYYDICCGYICKQYLEEDNRYYIEVDFHKQFNLEKTKTTHIYVDYGCVRVIEEKEFICPVSELAGQEFEDRLGFSYGEKTLEEFYNELEQEKTREENKKTEQAFKKFLS